MAEHVCPWWIGYFLLSPLRRLRQDPGKILAPYVREGMTVLEPGPGMGYFTLELARLVGSRGRVVAIDIQRKMLEKLSRRARKRGVADRIETRLASKSSLAIGDLKGKVDFVLAFAVVHELPPGAPFFRETAEALKRGGLLVLAEPNRRVKPPQFENELQAAAEAGFTIADRPSIGGMHSALLRARIKPL